MKLAGGLYFLLWAIFIAVLYICQGIWEGLKFFFWLIFEGGIAQLLGVG